MSIFFKHTENLLKTLGSVDLEDIKRRLLLQSETTRNNKKWGSVFIEIEKLPENASPNLSLIKNLIPWRMGPVKLKEIEIDSEWRSDLQWQRISKHLPNLNNLVVGDMGCSNGYLSCNLAQNGALSVFGFDPIERCWLQGEFTRKINNIDNVAFLPFGVEEYGLFPNCFDLLFCCGVLHHEREPQETIKNLKSMLRSNGKLFIEAMCVPGDLPVIPKERYAKMRNAWIIPTRSLLEKWILDAGLINVAFLYEHKISTDEQRKTEFAPYESLSDFLNPKDSEQTIEGYPAPYKIAFISTR